MARELSNTDNVVPLRRAAPAPIPYFARDDVRIDRNGLVADGRLRHGGTAGDELHARCCRERKQHICDFGGFIGAT